MLMAVLVVASHQLAPAHAAPSAPETAPPAALSNSIFQHLAAPAAARRSGAALGIRSAGEEAPAPESAEEESALSPRSHREPCCQLHAHTAGCSLHNVQQHALLPAP